LRLLSVNSLSLVNGPSHSFRSDNSIHDAAVGRNHIREVAYRSDRLCPKSSDLAPQRIHLNVTVRKGSRLREPRQHLALVVRQVGAGCVRAIKGKSVTGEAVANRHCDCR
jgi:hypothetical protein